MLKVERSLCGRGEAEQHGGLMTEGRDGEKVGARGGIESTL